MSTPIDIRLWTTVAYAVLTHFSSRNTARSMTTDWEYGSYLAWKGFFKSSQNSRIFCFASLCSTSNESRY